MVGFWDDSGISWTIMQTICTSLQADNHTNTSSKLTDDSSVNFYRPDALPHAQPTVSKAHFSYVNNPNPEPNRGRGAACAANK